MASDEAATGKNDNVHPPSSSGGSCADFWRGDEISTSNDYVPDAALAIYRTIALGISMYTLFRYSLDGLLHYEFLTTWTLVGTCVTFFFGACCWKRPSLLLRSFTSLLYHVFTSASLLVTIFYWALLYDPNDGIGVLWYRIYPHGIHFLFLLIDVVFLSRMEFRPWYILVLIGYLVAYLIFIFIRLAVTKEYVYGFLDPRVNSTGTLVLYYFAVIIGSIACGLVVLLLSRIPRLFRKNTEETETSTTKSTTPTNETQASTVDEIV